MSIGVNNLYIYCIILQNIVKQKRLEEFEKKNRHSTTIVSYYNIIYQSIGRCYISIGNICVHVFAHGTLLYAFNSKNRRRENLISTPRGLSSSVAKAASGISLSFSRFLTLRARGDASATAAPINSLLISAFNAAPRTQSVCSKCVRTTQKPVPAASYKGYKCVFGIPSSHSIDKIIFKWTKGTNGRSQLDM